MPAASQKASPPQAGHIARLLFFNPAGHPCGAATMPPQLFTLATMLSRSTDVEDWHALRRSVYHRPPPGKWPLMFWTNFTISMIRAQFCHRGDGARQRKNHRIHSFPYTHKRLLSLRLNVTHTRFHPHSPKQSPLLLAAFFLALPEIQSSPSSKHSSMSLDSPPDLLTTKNIDTVLLLALSPFGEVRGCGELWLDTALVLAAKAATSSLSATTSCCASV